MVYYLVAMNGEKVATLSGKTKANLIKEAAMIGKNLGINECYVKNIAHITKEKMRVGRIIKEVAVEPYDITRQSWYLYNDGGEWCFKMYKGCKTSHPVLP